ncbi:MAG: AmmeMemoRadiSam system protein A [Bacteroidales bacterium]
MNLSIEHRRLLLQLARISIDAVVRKNRNDEGHSPLTQEALQVKCGVFVSVYVDGKLRGCLGTFSEHECLWKNVQKMSVSAATEDFRFKPVRPEELDDLRIEISVLSPRRKITDISEIEPGKHGIYIMKGSSRGTLLPQVATEQKWDVYEFLGHCSKHKAGIGWEGWKDAEIYIYEALTFDSDKIEH